jgi:hypothetical protein
VKRYPPLSRELKDAKEKKNTTQGIR